MGEAEAERLLTGCEGERRLEFVTMRVGTPFGQSLVGTNFSHGGFVKGLMTGEIPVLPPLMLPAVDV